MFTSSSSSLLAASTLLLLATAQIDNSPYSKFINDANSLLAAATGTEAAQLDALYSWQLTQTAVPSADINGQYQDYLNAYMTTTSAPLPSWVTALPSSLQPAATSFLEAEASLVIQDIAPIVSQYDVSASAATATFAPQTTTLTTATSSPSSSNTTTTVVATPAPSVTASSGFATLSTNSTTAQVSSGNAAVSANGTVTASITSTPTATGSATNSVTPPTSVFTGGADRSSGAAGLAAVVGVLGMMVLL